MNVSTWPCTTDANGNLTHCSDRDTLDINGDGLPDLVNTTPGTQQCGYSQGVYICYYINANLNVYYNTGEGFAPPVAFVMPPDTAFRWSFNGNTYADLFDVNGDGLPDWVGVAPVGEGPSTLNNWNSQWYVALNQGGSFQALGTTTLYKMVTLPPPGGQVPVPYTAAAGLGPWTGAQGPIRQSTTGGNPQYTFIDLFDINGDGMLDRVNTNNSASWSMQANQNSTRPNLLVSLQNGLQGTTTLTYGPSSAYDNTAGDGISDLPFITWVTTSILQDDGTCAPPCSGHDLTATYWYQDGRLDSATREFRGFRAVYPVDAFNNWTFNYFGQGDISKGKVLEVDTFARGVSQLGLGTQRDQQLANRVSSKHAQYAALVRGTRQLHL
ncbi:MAG: toxin TcdB middle/N-terminal domain-containing protein [Candidatus Binatia bacterium]